MKIRPRHLNAAHFLGAGFSVSEVARQMKVHRGTIHRWQRNPEFDFVYRKCHGGLVLEMKHDCSCILREAIAGSIDALRELRSNVLDRENNDARTRISASANYLRAGAKWVDFLKDILNHRVNIDGWTGDEEDEDEDEYVSAGDSEPTEDEKRSPFYGQPDSGEVGAAVEPEDEAREYAQALGVAQDADDDDEYCSDENSGHDANNRKYTRGSIPPALSADADQNSEPLETEDPADANDEVA